MFMPFLSFSIISIILLRLHYMAALNSEFYVSYVFIIHDDDEIIKMIMVRLFGDDCLLLMHSVLFFPFFLLSIRSRCRSLTYFLDDDVNQKLKSQNVIY